MTLVTLMVTGTGKAVIGRNVHEIQENDIVILHSTRPFELRFPEDMQCWVLSIPASSLRSELLSSSSLTGQPIETNSGVGRLVLSLFESILLDSENMDEKEQRQTAEILLQALNMMAGSFIRTRGLKTLSKRQFLLDQAKLHIRENIRNPDLSALSVAQSLGISQRYMNKLFESERNSVAKLIVATRLEGAKQDLIDPLKALKPITDIAFDWGFNSVSHFSRVFKQQFGLSPRDHRNQSA